MKNDLDHISLPEQIMCIDAELKRRWQTLPGQVEDGVIAMEECDRELLRMEAVRYSLNVLLQARQSIDAEKRGLH